MIKGALFMFGSSVIFCGMGCMVRYVSSIDSFKVVMFRFIIGLAVLGTGAMLGMLKLKFVNGRLLLLRGLLGGTAVFIYFLSIARLGIGKGTVISYSFPVFAAFFSAVFLKEKIDAVKIGCVFTALAGVGLLSLNGGGGLGSIFVPGRYEMTALLGAVLSGMAVTSIKKLHDTDSTYAIFFAQCAGGLLLVIIPANVSGYTLGYTQAVILLVIGITATIAQLLMTTGYKYTTVTTGSLLGMLVPVLSVAAGYFLFKEIITLHELAGAAVVVLSCIVVIINDSIHLQR